MRNSQADIKNSDHGDATFRISSCILKHFSFALLLTEGVRDFFNSCFFPSISFSKVVGIL